MKAFRQVLLLMCIERFVAQHLVTAVRDSLIMPKLYHRTAHNRPSHAP